MIDNLITIFSKSTMYHLIVIKTAAERSVDFKEDRFHLLELILPMLDITDKMDYIKKEKLRQRLKAFPFHLYYLKNIKHEKPLIIRQKNILFIS